MTSATRTRITWWDLPPAVRSQGEQLLGGAVVEAVSQSGGFSPGTADRVRLADGRRAFVKAVSPMINEDSASMARREMRISAALPQSAPVPRMLGGFDDHDWVVLLLEDIDGAHPRTPWVDGEIDVCVTGLRELAAALTPAPLTGLPTAAEAHADIFGCWELLAADPPADLDPWAASHLPALRASAARGLASLARGETLTHADIRADNILVRGDGRAVFVDWPWGCVGPAWFDRVLLAANVVFAGGDADRVIRDLDPVVVTGVFAGLTGYFERQGRLADPPGIPHVRAFQRAQGAALLPWLRARLGD